MNLYKKYAKIDIKNRDGGYKNKLWFSPVDTFLSIAKPTTNVKLGDRFKISADHTFIAGDNGFIPMDGKINSATSKFTSVGDPGSQVFEHTIEITVLGNSPELYHQLDEMQNDDMVVLLKDSNCIDADSYDQWGDECLTPSVKVEFDAKTTADGNKEHKLTLTIRGHKYWYYGSVTEKPTAAALTCPVVSLAATSSTVTGTWPNAGAHHYEAKLFSNAGGTTQVGATAVLAVGVFTKQFTGLTTATQYYLQVIPVDADGSKKTTCSLVGIITP